MSDQPVVLTIAGYDPSGGAGVTADLRVIESMGCVGISAVTALTVQNTQGVQQVSLVDAGVLKSQLIALFSDINIAAVKIGMMGGPEQLDVILAVLRRYDPPNIVFDPVLESTSGHSLFEGKSLRSLISDLIPLCDLITPNLSEAYRITNLPVLDKKTMMAAGRRIIEIGARTVLIKGGHLIGDPVDIFIDESGSALVFEDKRIQTKHTHGTGCHLSSAIASGLALGNGMPASITLARESIRLGLSSPVVIGKGSGYPGTTYMSNSIQASAILKHAARLSKLTGIYVLADEDIRPDKSPISIASAALAGGAKVIQYRGKSQSTTYSITTAKALVKLVQENQGILIVNDRVDIALAAGADGVHLGPDDISPADARRLIGPSGLVGVSVATVEEAGAAEPYASYFGVGAVFGSTTKLDAGQAIGVQRLQEIKSTFPHIPIVAIGGINKGNVAVIRDCGVESAAVISAVVGAEDMTDATRELVDIWNGQ